jgi:glycosyltransferase involved in cell wall biosynthesis
VRLDSSGDQGGAPRDERMTAGRRPRVAVLWAGLGYMHASLRALADEGAELLVYHRSVDSDAPFEPDALTAGLSAHGWREPPGADELAAAIDDFDPDALLVCSWHIGSYRTVARHARGRTLRIVGLSNQWLSRGMRGRSRGAAGLASRWLSRPKQWAGVAISPLVVRPAYDAALVPDERAAVFAAKLGFPVERLIWGMNTCDQPRFAAVAHQRREAPPPKAFLFVGRLVADKALDVLADGYARYRAIVDEPWPLLVAGAGPDEHLLQDRDGVELAGFVQPADLPKLYEQAGCFVLPSRFEPWGVVIHEAVSAGLPVICTRSCGASTRLVLDGHNGVVLTPDDPLALGAAFRRIHEATDDERAAMGRASEMLSLQYTPARWAQNLLRRIPELRRQIGLPTMPRPAGR